MRVNVDKVLERDTKISELDDRAGKNQTGVNVECPLSFTLYYNCLLQNV